MGSGPAPGEDPGGGTVGGIGGRPGTGSGGRGRITGGCGPLKKTSPVPLSVTPCTRPVALLSLTMRKPAVVPAAVGLKVTAMVQVAPPLRVLPQVLVWEKAPPVPMPMMSSVTVPVLVSVTVRGLLLAPRNSGGKVSEEGDTLASGPIDT